MPADGTPNPGSEEARNKGCLCPVLDNNHGKWPPWAADDEHPEGSWWINAGCPLHDWSNRAS